MAIVKNKHEKLRFGAVGIANTLIDFGLLFILRWFGMPVLAANFFSTSVAFTFSFIANKNYTFKTSGANLRREVTSFLVVSLVAAWIIQPIVIYICLRILEPLDDSAALLIAKVVAVGAAIVWNYILYSRVVFKKKDREET